MANHSTLRWHVRVAVSSLPTQKLGTVRTSSDGSYTLIFILDSDAKTGNWKLKVVHGDHEESLSFTVKN